MPGAAKTGWATPCSLLRTSRPVSQLEMSDFEKYVGFLRRTEEAGWQHISPFTRHSFLQSSEDIQSLDLPPPTPTPPQYTLYPNYGDIHRSS